MSRRDVGAGRLRALRAATAEFEQAVLEAGWATSVSVRRAAVGGAVEEPVIAGYVDLVRRHAYRVDDADVERLRELGLDDDAIFELTVAAALGAARVRLDAGLAALGPEA